MQSVAEAVYAAGHGAGEVDKPVVDETGLEGRFDFIIHFTLGMNDREGPPPGGPRADAPPPDPSGAPFQNALRDQLGLKLKPSRAPIRTIVIDHVERPSEN
jgi:bla regulator protein blaR1